MGRVLMNDIGTIVRKVAQNIGALIDDVRKVN